MQSFKEQGYDTIKVYNGLGRDAYFAIVVAARAAEMKVVGHVPFSVGIWGALGAGQYSIEHFRGYDFNPARRSWLAPTHRRWELSRAMHYIASWS